MRYYIIAGEASGDLHGSNLMKGLYATDPQASIRFWGGDKMEEVYRASEGSQSAEQNANEQSTEQSAEQNANEQSKGGLVQHYKATAVMGISDVLKNLGRISRNLDKCKKDIESWNPDVVILIDYPGFNLKIAEFAHKKGLKVFYYIAPKVWASREGRIRKIKRFVDKLFIIFPFEIPYFTQKDIPFIYKGNPLIDAVDNSPAMKESREDFFKRHGLTPHKYIAILAGSRKGEISRMMPVCMEVVDKLCRESQGEELHFIVAGAPSAKKEDYLSYIGERKQVHLVFNDSYGILKNAACAIINSGTASLEAALIGTPQVVCWSSSALTVFVGRKILRIFDHIKYISLGNLIVDRLVFKEFIQEDFNVEMVTEEIGRLMSDDYRQEMLKGYAEIRSALGGQGASTAIAQAMLTELQK